MIFITGDTHFPRDIEKLNELNFTEYKNLTKKDYVIITGDFGAIWDNSKQELYYREWLQKRNFTTLFIDGNHENFDLLYKFPIEDKFDGKVHKINDSIYHFMRGQVFNINGLKFWTMGGATSTDKENRQEHISWWQEEIPNQIEMTEGLANLEKHNNEVDYILTHTCSNAILRDITEIFGFQPKPEENLNKYLEIIEEKVKFKHWYFGHFHEDIEIDEKHTMIFEKIIRIQ
ncbi:metallophosphoesterase [Clostridium botulinum]|uniref:metallophosphoesterase family protein n=1 Tax=Clostridium botulinum TaxID=1491 RepID=UPI000774A2CC|nr:metallophosphoesterase [Clostridium botulinum]MBN3430425.1 metallophosphatase [Clostridium botulinum]NFC04711.1 metallophosphoesterase [Clostridium botulinum]NFC12113.1 metallophosphoesterase [Clostridium botulinum]NFC16319.1 metallophosphoesterase [Clostridium botulinum]NFC21040.1 metallophosphoesterase [Clostridium botulinum]